jgi:hypothetical protein
MKTRHIITAALLAGTLAACSSSGSGDTAPTGTDAPITTDAPMTTDGADHSDGHDHSAMTAGLGTSPTADGFTLNVATFDNTVTGEQQLGFVITGEADTTVTEFEAHHEKKMHMVIVKHDLTGYQHLHPEMAEDGSWRVPVAFGTEGFFHVVVDFVSGGKAVVLGTDLQVGSGPMVMAELDEESRTAVSGPYQAVLIGDTAHEAAAPLKVEFTKNGAPVEQVNPYLGANAHMVAISPSNLGYTHMHPNDGFPGGVMTFTAPAMGHGFYKLFLQADFDGEIRLFEFVIEGK